MIPRSPDISARRLFSRKARKGRKEKQRALAPKGKRGLFVFARDSLLCVPKRSLRDRFFSQRCNGRNDDVELREMFWFRVPRTFLHTGFFRAKLAKDAEKGARPPKAKEILCSACLRDLCAIVFSRNAATSATKVLERGEVQKELSRRGVAARAIFDSSFPGHFCAPAFFAQSRKGRKAGRGLTPKAKKIFARERAL